MEQSEFDERFAKIQAMLKTGDNSYQIKDVNDVWTNVGSTHLDNLFTELSALYLKAEDSQRLTLYNYCGQQRAILENLYLYIRRIGKLIHVQDDKKWLEFGIASAMMDGGRVDSRDTILSLVLLRFVAERHGINAQSVLDRFIQTAQGNMKGLLENIRNHPESSIHMTVQDFGPPEWAAESVKIYGEYNMETFAKATKEEWAKQDQAKQNKAQEKKTFWKMILGLFKHK